MKLLENNQMVFQNEINKSEKEVLLKKYLQAEMFQ